MWNNEKPAHSFPDSAPKHPHHHHQQQHRHHALAPQVRPPMPPSYVFVLDVSFAAVSSGMLRVACAAIRDCLDRLPGEDRTQVAFLTFDRCVWWWW